MVGCLLRLMMRVDYFSRRKGGQRVSRTTAMYETIPVLASVLWFRLNVKGFPSGDMAVPGGFVAGVGSFSRAD